MKERLPNTLDASWFVIVELKQIHLFKRDTLSVSWRLLECGIASVELLRWILTVDYLSRIALRLWTQPFISVITVLLDAFRIWWTWREPISHLHILDKFVQYQGVVHLQVAERVLQYVCGTHDQGITYCDLGAEVQGMISSFFLGIDWFDYGAFGLEYQVIW